MWMIPQAFNYSTYLIGYKTLYKSVYKSNRDFPGLRRTLLHECYMNASYKAPSAVTHLVLYGGLPCDAPVVLQCLIGNPSSGLWRPMTHSLASMVIRKPLEVREATGSFACISR